MNYERIRALCEPAGIPGREYPVMDIIAKELQGFPIVRDALGNLLVTVQEAQGDHPTILLEAHADRIGLMVSHFLADGFVRVVAAGGVDVHTVMGSEVIIEGKDGPIIGIVGAPFPHPAKPHNSAPASEYKMPEIGAMFVDTGLAKPEEKIRLGAQVLMAGKTFPLLGDRVAAPGLDNRICCATLLDLADQLKKDKPRAGVQLLFTTREEVGGIGASTGAFSITADYAVVLDTAFGLSPDTKEADCAALGKGPEIGIAALLDDGLTQRLIETAQHNEIPYQITVFGRTTGTDADSVTTAAAGFRTALLSIPIRYMHHPVETVDLADADTTVRLLSALIGGL